MSAAFKYGRVVSRGPVCRGQLWLNGQTYHLEANNGASNHSGPTGWDGTLYSVESVTDQKSLPCT